jgi:hypothetical protein
MRPPVMMKQYEAQVAALNAEFQAQAQKAG